MSEYHFCIEEVNRSDWDEKTRLLYEYWLSRKTPGILPGRQHVDPLEIPKLLPWIFLHDINRDPFRVRCRLTGTEVVEFIGIDPTGKWFDEVHSSTPVLLELLPIFESIADSGQAIRKRRRAVNLHRNYLQAEIVIVPLSGDGVTVDMTMGVLSVSYPPKSL